MSARGKSVHQKSAVNQKPSAPDKLFLIIQNKRYKFGPLITDNCSFTAHEVFLPPDEAPYLYKVYKYDANAKQTFESFEKKVRAEAQKLEKFFSGIKVQIIKADAKNQQIGLLMPRYSPPISIKDKKYRLDTLCLGEGNFGGVFELKPEDPEEEPLALKMFKSASEEEQEKEVKNEIKNLADFYDTALFNFPKAKGLLMPRFEGEPVLTYIDGRHAALHPELPDASLSLQLYIVASMVQKALIEALPRAHRKDGERIHGDLKTANVLLKIARGEDKHTYFQIELIDGGDLAIGTPVILGPETVEWLDEKCYFKKEKCSIAAETYALSSILATVLTASRRDPEHVLSKKVQVAKEWDAPNQPFSFDLMAQMLRKKVQNEIKKFKTREAKHKSNELIQAIEAVIQIVEAMGSQDPAQRPDPFTVLRVLIDAANLSFELEQVEKGINLNSEPKPTAKRVSEKAVIPNRHHLLSQNAEKKQAPEIDQPTAEEIAGEKIEVRKKIEEKMNGFLISHQQRTKEFTELISRELKGLLSQLKKINSSNNDGIIDLINRIKPAHSLEAVLEIIDRIIDSTKKAAEEGIIRATKRKRTPLGFFCTDNTSAYQAILQQNIPVLEGLQAQYEVLKETIANDGEYQGKLRSLKKEIEDLKSGKQPLPENPVIFSPAPQG